ncbi:DNA endonuclease SmrA [Alginatibacterium sediminis]|uniref:DNA endonuclease SmrA n=1 Tax=Alginatibacterium sediminis TaxID=2164068 RepID=A0A420EAP5_9ALTE|nr:DNA endonuclease SmrA [Alginatibacterium sediminis]RKF17769.1 DNA endonuclease SmrA [Alginatibacterium sediminis]
MTEDDTALFHEQFSDVKPLAQNQAQLSTKPSGPSLAQQARRLAASEMSSGNTEYLSLDHVNLIHPDDFVAYKKDGVQDGVFKKMRLGKYALDARLDLHQHRLEQARIELLRFVEECQRLSLRCLLIVHGKGHKSKPPALLKSYVSQWLPQLSQVLAIHSAQAQDGGTGALYVLLKKSDSKKLENRERHARRLA